MLNTIIGLGLLLIVGYFLAQGNIVETFFDLIDLGDNLKRTRNFVRRQDGWPAAVLGVSFAALAYGCGVLAYRFDLLPTWEYASWVATFVVEGAARQEVATAGLIITLMPTLIELTAVGLGRDGLKMVTYLVFVFAGIDVITDWPASSQLIDGWIARGLFDNWWGWAAVAGEYLLKGGWTIMASFGFEMLTVVFGAGALMLMLVALPDNNTRGGKGRPNPHPAGGGPGPR
jgi:hypothetical protein